MLLTCVISGSFERFKPLIDDTHRELKSYGVDVLEPPLGPVRVGKLYIPTGEEVRRYGDTSRPVWPLDGEVDLSIRGIEDRFLAALGRASFAYLVAPGGYIGETAAFELGFGLGVGVLLYASDMPIFEEPTDSTRELCNHIHVMDVPDAVEHTRQLL